MKKSLGKRFFILSLAFLMMPHFTLTMNGSSGELVTSHVIMDEPSARADDFQSLNSQMGGKRIEELAIF